MKFREIFRQKNCNMVGSIIEKPTPPGSEFEQAVGNLFRSRTYENLAKVRSLVRSERDSEFARKSIPNYDEMIAESEEARLEAAHLEVKLANLRRKYALTENDTGSSTSKDLVTREDTAFAPLLREKFERVNEIIGHFDSLTEKLMESSRVLGYLASFQLDADLVDRTPILQELTDILTRHNLAYLRPETLLDTMEKAVARKPAMARRA